MYLQMVNSFWLLHRCFFLAFTSKKKVAWKLICFSGVEAAAATCFLRAPLITFTPHSVHFTITGEVFSFVLCIVLCVCFCKSVNHGRDWSVDLFGLHRLRHQAHGRGQPSRRVLELPPVRERRRNPVHGRGQLVRVLVESVRRAGALKNWGGGARKGGK